MFYLAKKAGDSDWLAAAGKQLASTGHASNVISCPG
jgi:hypothetical protein